MGVVDQSTTPTPGVTQEPAPRGIGGCVWREASIEGVRFRCNLRAASRLYALLTHRNLRHAGRRLKRGFRFRRVLWLLPSKESNNKNNLHSAGVTAWAVTPKEKGVTALAWILPCAHNHDAQRACPHESLLRLTIAPLPSCLPLEFHPSPPSRRLLCQKWCSVRRGAACCSV